MAKKEAQLIERTYNVPLRKEYRKAPRWKRTPKAVKALKQFLEKHMKSDNVNLDGSVNTQLWKHGMKNPPHHIKVTVTKDEEGVVNASLFGAKKEKTKVTKKDQKEAKKSPKKEVAAPAPKTETKPAAKETVKETPKESSKKADSAKKE